MTQQANAVKRALWSLEQHLPERTQMALRCRRRRGAWAGAGVIFIHVPKAAGTSISTALYGRSLGHLPASAIRKTCPDLWRDLPSFAVMRDPAERALSAWRFARAGGTAEAGASQGVRGIASAARSFSGFVESYLSTADLSRADPVFRPQIQYLSAPSGELLPEKLFRLERLEEMLDWLAARLGQPITLPSLNRAPTAEEEPLPPALRQRLAEIYAADQQAYDTVRGAA